MRQHVREATLAAENVHRPSCPVDISGGSTAVLRGAGAFCAAYSIIKTAKQNGLRPYACLSCIFTKVPQITNEAEWDEFLPKSVDPDEINNARFARVR